MMQKYVASRNKTFKTIFIALIGILGLFLVIGIYMKMQQNEKLKEWTKIVAQAAKDRKTEKGQELYAKGKTVEIPQLEYEQMVQYYQLNGMKEEEAKESADIYVKERYAIYADAIQNGYTVTKEELNSYIDELKKEMHENKNKKTRQMVEEAFGTEDTYWEYEKILCKIDIPIKNYINDLGKKFQEENKNAKDEEWEKEFNKLKKEMVEKENFQLVKK